MGSLAPGPSSRSGDEEVGSGVGDTPGQLIRSRSMRGLTIDSRQISSGWLAVSVGGEIDIASVDELQSAIDDVYETHSGGLAVDLTASTFMDSTGLKALVMADRRFKEDGRSFAIVVSGGPVSRLIDLSGVNTTIRTVSSLDDLETEEA